MSVDLAQRQGWAAPFQCRRHARIKATLEVEYRIVAEPAAPEVPAAHPARPSARLRQTVATSVSGGGLLLESGERLPAGTRLALTVLVPGAALNASLVPLHCEARVVWTDIVSDTRPDEYRCGVEFLTIEEADRRWLLAYIHAREATDPLT